MDDKELDSLFGSDSENFKKAIEEEEKALKKPVVKKAVKKEPAEKKADKRKEQAAERSAEEKHAKPTDKKEAKKEPEEKVSPDKKDEDRPKEKPEDKEKEPEEIKASGEPEKDESDEDKSDKEGSDEKESDKDEDGEEGEEDKEDEEESSEEESKKPEDKPSAPAKARRQRVRREPEPEPAKSQGEMIPLSGKSIFAIVLALAVVVMVILVMFLPAFRVRNATVEGNVALSDQEILAAAGLEYNAHLMSGISGNIFDVLRLNYGKTEERIMKENPYIEDIRITIKLPSTVEIKVKERSKICYIRTPDGYAALDKDGIVLELSSFDSGKDVRPVICGLDVKYCELGKPVRIDNMNDYKKAIIVLGAILAADNASIGDEYQMFENTAEVRILPSGYIFLTIYSPSGHLIQIKLNGTESIGDKMAWLLYVFNGDGFDKITVDGALDMTGTTENTCFQPFSANINMKVSLHSHSISCCAY